MKKRGLCFGGIVLFFLCIACRVVSAETTVVSGMQEQKQGESNSFSKELEEELMGELEFDEIQKMIDEILGKNNFSFSETMKKLMSGKEFVSKEAAWELLRGLFFSVFEREKETFFRILMLVLLGAVFANFIDVFQNGQIAAVSFYTVYLLLFTTLMEKFSGLEAKLVTEISKLSEFMKVLSPAYFLAMAAAGGFSTATVFQEGVLLLTWMIQWVIQTLLLPGTNLFILMKLINHISREEMLSKMAELLETGINWGLKTLLGLALGLQVVKNLIAPVMDVLKKSALGKTVRVIPGVGNAVSAVTELILTSAVLVRNSFGVTSLLVLVLIGIKPMVHLGILSLAYRFLGALSQPISDKRIVGALCTFGEGCSLLLRILFTTELLCMLTFLVLLSGNG